jgi:hypothetical protein
MDVYVLIKKKYNGKFFDVNMYYNWNFGRFSNFCIFIRYNEIVI